MEPVAHDTWVIIADGSTDLAEGQRKLADLQRRVFPLRLARGYPTLVDSATLPGLKPGFNVVVVGACGDRAMADLRLELTRTFAPGAYLRQAVAPEACPAIDRATAPVAGGPALGTWPFGPSAHFEFHRPSGGACPDQTGVIELRLEDQSIVSTLVLPGTCGVDGSTAWDTPSPVGVDGATFLAIRSRARAGETEVVNEYLYGFACGQWRTMLGPLTAGGSGGYRYENLAPGQLRVTGAPADEVLYMLDPATCALVPEEPVLQIQ